MSELTLVDALSNAGILYGPGAGRPIGLPRPEPKDVGGGGQKSGKAAQRCTAAPTTQRIFPGCEVRRVRTEVRTRQ